MRPIDIFGVLRPSMGQVKACPLFQSATPVTPPPLPAEPVPPTTPPPAPAISAQGVLLTADVRNEAGETARGITLYPGADPAYLVAEAFGIRKGAPDAAFTPDGLKNFSIPMSMNDQSPAIIQSTLASVPEGYAKRVWFWKLDKAPVEMAIPPAEMTDVDGTPLVAIAWKFPQVGSFYVVPDAVVLKDGDKQSMNFVVKVVSNLGRNDRTARTTGVQLRQVPVFGTRPIMGRVDLHPARNWGMR